MEDLGCFNYIRDNSRNITISIANEHYVETHGNSNKLIKLKSILTLNMFKI